MVDLQGLQANSHSNALDQSAVSLIDICGQGGGSVTKYLTSCGFLCSMWIMDH